MTPSHFRIVHREHVIPHTERTLREYSHDLYLTYKRTHLKGEYLWENFITALGPHAIKSWTRANLIKWADLFQSRRVFVRKDISNSRTECIIDLIYRTDNIAARAKPQDGEN